MNEKIILDADETIVCPKCAHEFTLGDGMTRQTIDRHAEEFEALLTTRRRELEEHLAQEAQRKATQASAAEIAKLQDQVAGAKRAEREAKEAIEKAREEARDKAVAETEQDRKAWQEDLARKDEAIKQFR